MMAMQVRAPKGGWCGYEGGQFIPTHDEVSARPSRLPTEAQLAERAARAIQLEIDRAASQHIGTVGARVHWPLTVRKVIKLADDGMGYGPKFLTIAHTQGGDVVVSFGARWADNGDTPTIKATIKAHTERDGVKQTIIQRIKVA